MKTVEQASCDKCGRIYEFTPHQLCQCEHPLAEKGGKLIVKGCYNCKHHLKTVVYEMTGVGVCNLSTECVDYIESCPKWE